MSIFNFPKRKNKYYSNIFIVLLLSIVVTIFIVSSIQYLFFENIGMNLINTYESRNLSKVSYSTTFMMDWAKMMSVQIYQDRDIKKLLYDASPLENEKNISYIRLASYRNSSPGINSIYIYNGVSKNIYYDSINGASYSSPDFFDKEILNLINKEPGIKHLLPFPRKIKSDPVYSLNTLYNVYTFVFYETPSIRRRRII
jgi:two-component system, response regulator YesN